MKAIIPVLSILLTTIGCSTALAGLPTSSLRLAAEQGTPTLTIRNLRIDPRDGKIRGTAYVTFGYAAPRVAHVHAYALNTKGVVVGETCDTLSGALLAPHPRLSQKGRDAFSMTIPAGDQVREVRLVAHVGRHDGC
jgi:hypothetical protein